MLSSLGVAPVSGMVQTLYFTFYADSFVLLLNFIYPKKNFELVSEKCTDDLDKTMVIQYVQFLILGIY